MSSPTTEQTKVFWTTSKILGVVVITILVIGVGAGLYYLPPRGNNSILGSSNCSNGASNYPTCNTCPSGQVITGNSCVESCANGGTDPPTCTPPKCSNGATNFPGCNICPVGQTLVGGTCYNNCINGAINPPACTTFNTTTSMTCSPTNIMAQLLTSSSCVVTVAATAAAPPTGTISFSASYTWYADQPPSTPCTLQALPGGFSSYCTLTGVGVKDNHGDLIITANYAGDASHEHSSGTATLTVSDPPSRVTVAGYVTTTGFDTHPTMIHFTGSDYITYSTSVTSAGTYAINLPNLVTYTVTVDWTGLLGAGGTCNAGSLALRSEYQTWDADYSC